MKNFNLAHNLPLVISLLVVTISLPLALFVGLTQQTTFESNAKAGKFSWEFNQKGNLEGWTGAGFAKNVTVNNGYLKAATVDTKGKEIMIKSALFSPQLENFSGQIYPQLKLRMRVVNPSATKDTPNGKMILEWYYQPNQNIKPKLSSQLFIDTIEDGKYHTYTVNLANEPIWTKYFIKQIKLTPTVANPRTIYLDWVRFSKQPITPTPTTVPVTEVRLTEIGTVIKYQPKLSQADEQNETVLGLTTEDFDDSPTVEDDEQEFDASSYGDEFDEELNWENEENEENDVLGASTICKYDNSGKSLCPLKKIFPVCPNGKPISVKDNCGCPRFICPPTVTPTPPQPEENFALQTEDKRVYVLKRETTIIPPCQGQDCPVYGPEYFLDFSQYVGKTVLVEGILEGNFPVDTICTLSYPPTCFPGYPYPAEGTLRVGTVHLAEKYATDQTQQGYLYPSDFNYVNENVYLFNRDIQINYLSPQPYPCEGNDCPVPSEPSVMVIPGESEGVASPGFGSNDVWVLTNKRQETTTTINQVPPRPGDLIYARSSTVNLGAFVNNQVRLTSDGYYVGEQKDRFLNVKKAEPVTITPTPYPTSIVCNNPLQDAEFYNQCGDNSYQYVKYTCSNGYTGILGSPASCQDATVWKNEANLICQNQCSNPTPTVIKRCSSQGSCRNGESCPVGTSCSGMPAYGCYPDGCPTPICLAKDTRISTPNGASPVQDLREGSLVLSVNQYGEKITVPLLRVSKTKVLNHRVTYLTLTDGRTLWVSPKHPTIDSRTVSDLKPGEFYDGAQVLRAELIPYQDEYTYDLLPDGPTGFYFANGIMLNSTLR